jgi:hypothetical protein
VQSPPALGGDEQREQYCLDAVVDGHTDLTDNHDREQRSGHATQLKLSELDAADPISNYQG